MYSLRQMRHSVGGRQRSAAVTSVPNLLAPPFQPGSPYAATQLLLLMEKMVGCQLCTAATINMRGMYSNGTGMRFAEPRQDLIWRKLCSAPRSRHALPPGPPI